MKTEESNFSCRILIKNIQNEVNSMANNKKIFIDFYSKQKNDTFSIDDAVRDSYEGNKFRNDMFVQNVDRHN